MMNNAMPVACRQWAEKLAVTHTRDLSPGDRAALSAHIATCAACAAVFAEYHAMDTRILNLPPVAPLQGLPAQFVEDRDHGRNGLRNRDMVGATPAVALESGETRAPHEPVSRRRRIGNLASSFAAVLVVAGVIGSFLLLWTTHRAQGTLSSSHTPVVSASSAPAQILSTSCPSNKVARSAVMPSLTLGNHNTLIYVDNETSGGILKRYDAVTQRSTDILHLANATITDAQLSSDGQWVLFESVVGIIGSAPVELQLIRVDGKYLQTLYCFGPMYGNFLWSPDMQTLLFAEGNQSTTPILFTLNLTTGKVQPILHYTNANIYSLVEWRDSTRAYLVNSVGDLYLLDITKGPNQTTSDLQLMKKAWLGSFDQCLDGTQLYISTYTGSPKAHVGPSEITVKTLVNGSTQTLYQSKTQAIDNLNVFSSAGLIFTIDTYAPAGGDTSQNGLWTIDLFGYGLKHLVTLALPYSLNMFSREPWSNVSRDGQFYALKIETNSQDTLVVGSMNGGPYTTINARSHDGWTYSGAVGWTTI